MKNICSVVCYILEVGLLNSVASVLTASDSAVGSGYIIFICKFEIIYFAEVKIKAADGTCRRHFKQPFRLALKVSDFKRSQSRVQLAFFCHLITTIV